MSEPARAVVSQQWLVVMPHTAMPSHACSRSQAARSGDPRNAECTDFATSRSGLAGDDLLKGVPTAVRAQRRALLPRVVAYEHRSRRIAPCSDQLSDVALTLGVVARSPALSVIETLLHLDDDERDVIQVGHCDAGLGWGRSITRSASWQKSDRAARLPARAVAAE